MKHGGRHAQAYFHRDFVSVCPKRIDFSVMQDQKASMTYFINVISIPKLKISDRPTFFSFWHETVYIIKMTEKRVVNILNNDKSTLPLMINTLGHNLT